MGIFKIFRGKYIYTGSALKNLQHRVARHLRKEKKIKWHIDYLTTNENIEIKKVKIYKSQIKNECQINLETINKINATTPIPKFGSSDCSICPSHLIKY